MVIRLLRGELPPEQAAAESLAVSSVVCSELWTSVFHGGGDRERARLKDFFVEVEIVGFDALAAETAASIRSSLWKAGTPIGDYDTLIAGHAIAAGLPLLTDNVCQFSRVPNLMVILWRD